MILYKDNAVIFGQVIHLPSSIFKWAQKASVQWKGFLPPLFPRDSVPLPGGNHAYFFLLNTFKYIYVYVIKYESLVFAFKFFLIYWFLEKEGETSICCFTYICIHWLILVSALTWDWTHNLGYGDDALTNSATQPGWFLPF